MKNNSIFKRLGVSLNGIRETFMTEKSFRTEVFALIFVVFFIIIARPKLFWDAILLSLCSAVLSAEMFNTAVEKMIDHAHPYRHETLKVIKDTLSGGILVLAIVSVMVFFLCLEDTFNLQSVYMQVFKL